MTESKAWGDCPVCGGTGENQGDSCCENGCDPEMERESCKGCKSFRPDCPVCLAHFKAVSDAVQGERERISNEAQRNGEAMLAQAKSGAISADGAGKGLATQAHRDGLFFQGAALIQFSNTIREGK